jgi:type IV pilus assembly protein PilB
MSTLPRPRLGELLVRAGVISPEQADAAAVVHRANGRTIGQQLLADGAVTELELASALSYQLDVPLVLLDSVPIDAVAVHLTPLDFSREHRLLVIGSRDDDLLVAMVDPVDLKAREAVTERTGRHVIPLLAMATDLGRALDRVHPAPATLPEPVAEPEPPSPGELVPFPRAGPRLVPDAPRTTPVETPAPPAAPPRSETPAPRAPATVTPIRAANDAELQIVRFVLAQAARESASDVHVEPLADRLRVRVRVEGQLRELTQLPREMAASVAARIRALAGMSPSDTQGRLVVRDEGKEATFEVSAVGTLWGEKIVLRVIERTGEAPDLDGLGMEAGTLERWRELLRAPYGLLLVAGLPGMGKTTTLYASLRELPTSTKDITTVEDPVDHALEGVNQVQVDRTSLATLASTLRAVLAQEPDVLLVGDMRDREVADLSLQAALAGRLVLSQVQAPDALSALYRVLGLGSDPKLVATGTVAVLAQLLLPRLCEHCKQPVQPQMVEAALLRQAGLPYERVYVARGCARCNGTGHRGRAAAFELLLPTDELRAAIERGAPIEDAREIATRGGLVSLREAGLRLVSGGLVAMSDLLGRLPSTGA